MISGSSRLQKMSASGSISCVLEVLNGRAFRRRFSIGKNYHVLACRALFYEVKVDKYSVNAEVAARY